MQSSKISQLKLSKELTDFLYEFELEKKVSAITLFDFFVAKGLLFSYQKIIVDEAKEKIEELRTSARPILTLILSIIFGLAFIVGLFLIAAFPLGYTENGYLLGIFGLLIGGGILYFGIHRALTNVIIYRDRLVFRKPLSKKKIFWHQIDHVEVQNKIRVNKQKTFIGTWREVNRETVGVILIVFLVDGQQLSLDLETYGLSAGEAVLFRIFTYMMHFNSKIKLPGSSTSEQLSQAIAGIYNMMNTNPSQAFEYAINLLIKEERNPNVWKLATIIIASILPDEAFPFLEMSLSQLPTDADLWNSRGLAYEQLGNKDLALESYLKALAIYPEHRYARNNYNRLTGKGQVSFTPLQWTTPIEIVSKPLSEQPKPKIIITHDDIEQLRSIIGTQTQIRVGHLVSLTGMFKDKIIKIAIEQLDFRLNDDILIKDTDAPEKDRLANIERLRHLIGNKPEVELDYLEVITKLPLEEITYIVENELFYKIKNGKVVQK